MTLAESTTEDVSLPSPAKRTTEDSGTSDVAVAGLTSIKSFKKSSKSVLIGGSDVVGPSYTFEYLDRLSFRGFDDIVVGSATAASMADVDEKAFLPNISSQMERLVVLTLVP